MKVSIEKILNFCKSNNETRYHNTFKAFMALQEGLV
jgi:hypothetical protein